MKVKGFNEFNKINEDEDIDDVFDRDYIPSEESDEPEFTNMKDEKGSKKHMFDENHGDRMELVKLFKELTEYIKKINPKDEEDLQRIKDNIKEKKDEIMNHPNYDELKNEGFPWQDTFLTLDDLLFDLKNATDTFQKKLERRL